MGDSLLPSMFAEECEKSNRRGLRIRRRLEVAGLSQYPDDFIYDVLVCSSSESESNPCVVVNGAVSIYSSEASSANADKDEVLKLIKQDMASGAYDDEHEDIVKVKYVDIKPK